MGDATGTSEIPKLIFDPQARLYLGEGQCDACTSHVTAGHDSPLPPLPDVPYQRHTDLVEHPIPPTEYNAVLSPEVGTFALLNRSARNLLCQFSAPRPLGKIDSVEDSACCDLVYQTLLSQMMTLGLLIPEHNTTPRKEVSQTLATWLHLTDRCNLRCSYCYLPHTSRDMSLEVGRAAIDATFRSALVNGYRQVKVKYAGGEPLLCFPRCAELHRYARSVAERLGLDLDGVVVSNGTLLTANVIQALQELGLRLTISLDSLDDARCQRPYIGGRSSTADIVQAIETALDCGLKPYISVTVSHDTISGLPYLVEWLLVHDLPFGLNFYRESPRASSTRIWWDKEAIVDGLLAAYRVIEGNLPQHSLLTSLSDRASLFPPHLRPCSVGHSYLVVDPLGRIAKCQMDMDCTVADVSDPDPLAIVRHSSLGVCNPSVDEKPECKTCRWRYWCAGGCPLQAYQASGHYGAKSPCCEIYRSLLPEILRLEGLRLLEYSVPMYKRAIRDGPSA